MEYNITLFTQTLLDLILNSDLFPYDKNEEGDRKRHPKRNPLHLNTVVRQETHIVGFENMESFEIGSDFLESEYPYYHILQNAPVIRKRGKGTNKSKGSQMFVADKGKRDYEQVHWNGKTFTKEYQRNVRGKRLNLNNTTMHIDGQFINQSVPQYLNIHYKYIDNIVRQVAPKIAYKFGMKIDVVENSGLIDEFAEQEGTDIESVLGSLKSFKWGSIYD